MVRIREVSFRMRYHTIYLYKYFKQSKTDPPWPSPVGQTLFIGGQPHPLNL